MIRARSSSWIILLPLLAGLAACGGGTSGFPGKGASVDGANYGGSAPSQQGGYYKVGKPYQIAGLWYHPREDFNYVETGIASWYGPNFHGLATANGEIYDMEALTAAHRTLQMPSVVRVTNLDNGRSVVVRINDRGPFARDRIIDMSRRAAAALGFEQRGTANVRVEMLPEESRMVAELARDGADPEMLDRIVAGQSGRAPTVQLAAAQPVPGRTPMLQPAHLASAPMQPLPVAEPATDRTPSAGSLFVQAGAFSMRDNALRLRSELSRYGEARVDEAAVGGRTLYRVRLGPLASADAAQRTLSTLTENGYASAKVIVE